VFTLIWRGIHRDSSEEADYLECLDKAKALMMGDLDMNRKNYIVTRVLSWDKEHI
jgi:hypothetical protein